MSQGLGLAGAWRPRPAHLLGDPGLQLPADVAPGHAVQVLQLAQQQQGPAMGVCVPGARLELQPHARHLPPSPATPAGPPSTLRPTPARLGAAPARPASALRLPRRLRTVPPCRAHPGREGAPAEAGRGPQCAFRASVGVSGARAPGTAPAPAATLARLPVDSWTR